MEGRRTLACKLTTPELQKRKATILESLRKQVIEKREFGQQTFDADQFPAGDLFQHAIQIVEFRDRIGRHAEALLVVDELAAGAAEKHFALAFEERSPGRVP